MRITRSEKFYKAANATGNALNTATRATGRGLWAAFNSATGNKRLHDRGLKQGYSKKKATLGGGLSCLFGIVGGSQAGLWTGAVLFPVIGPAAIPVAVAVAAVASMIPARAHAEYLIGRHEHQLKNALKI